MKHAVEDNYNLFSPRKYLEEFYSLSDGDHLNSALYSLLRFYAQAYTDLPRNALMLEFGGGPSIHQLISAAPNVKEIHFSDYLESNLEEVSNWKIRKENSFNWKAYIKEAIVIEKFFNEELISGEKISVTKNMVLTREKLLQKKITTFLHCNAFLNDPLGPEYRAKYDVIGINLVTEGITTKKNVWKQLVANISSLLKKNGILVTTELRDADFWRVGDVRFPACPVTEIDLIHTLSDLGFQDPCILLNRIEDPKIPGAEEFKGCFMLKARK